MTENTTLTAGAVPAAPINRISALEAMIAELKAKLATLDAAGVGKWNGRRRATLCKLYHAEGQLDEAKYRARVEAQPKKPRVIHPGPGRPRVNPYDMGWGWSYSPVDCVAEFQAQYPAVVTTLEWEKGGIWSPETCVVGYDAEGRAIAHT